MSVGLLGIVAGVIVEGPDIAAMRRVAVRVPEIRHAVIDDRVAAGPAEQHADGKAIHGPRRRVDLAQRARVSDGQALRIEDEEAAVRMNQVRLEERKEVVRLPSEPMAMIGPRLEGRSDRRKHGLVRWHHQLPRRGAGSAHRRRVLDAPERPELVETASEFRAPRLRRHCARRPRHNCRRRGLPSRQNRSTGRGSRRARPRHRRDGARRPWSKSPPTRRSSNSTPSSSALRSAKCTHLTMLNQAGSLPRTTGPRGSFEMMSGRIACSAGAFSARRSAWSCETSLVIVSQRPDL